ncbi:aminopeptidase [Thermosipho melanesiensis]|uniref:Peptidase M42 family protein n=2 Tax=Thermosipho melanesiensis TaxID=46541 RepID=A6LJI1_THEM4|nr:M42 family metallopeptidase [Thermosipho melanesiensis]ABR30082.1 peptidase M42 family protein [Thermosipho melanesiensis BI429]APT73279.1 aminopeptidase [Thermosipho melanesiensis]OOC38672.1 aminopeptidase [Thermosipho melanesiensis]OOC40476.1 aminopeptidase [Thermosipho melanesiensis]OOC40741.1 aminopeptidase [Thermosipho melanesiensis]
MKDLIRKLTETHSPSGREDEIRKVILSELDGFIDGYKVDKLGNLIVWKTGRSDRKILLDAHMDEIGVVVTNIDDKGFLKIDMVGGVSPYTIFRSKIRFGDIIGIVDVEGETGAILSENIKNLSFDKLYVDIGAKSREEAEKLCSIGTFGTFDGYFVEKGDFYISKSLDDRIGCAVIIETFKRLKNPENTVYGVFAVQEEIGIVGARVAGYEIDPDVAIAIDVTGAGDTPKANKRISMKLGSGACIKVKDGYSISDRKIVETLRNLAEKHNIPYQMEVLIYGGTDARGYQNTKAGIPSATISIATRYIHTPNEMVHKNDVEATIQLILKYIEEGL